MTLPSLPGRRPLGRPGRGVKVGQGKVVAADQRADERPGLERLRRVSLSRPRNEPLRVKQGAGLENAMRRVPVKFGQDTELGVCRASAASRAGDSPSARIASCNARTAPKTSTMLRVSSRRSTSAGTPRSARTTFGVPLAPSRLSSAGNSVRDSSSALATRRGE